MINKYLRPAIGIILIARILYLGESIPTQAEIRMLAVGAVLAVGLLCFGDVEFVKEKRIVFGGVVLSSGGTFLSPLDGLEAFTAAMQGRIDKKPLALGIAPESQEFREDCNYFHGGECDCKQSVDICVTEEKPE